MTRTTKYTIHHRSLYKHSPHRA